MILKKVLVHLGWILSCRAVGLHSVFVDLDPDRALFLNADPNPAVQNCFVTFKLCKKVYRMKSLPIIYANWVPFLNFNKITIIFNFLKVSSLIFFFPS